MEWLGDKVLEHPDPSRMSIDEGRAWKLKGFKQAFEFHYKNCPEYNTYCKLHDTTPNDINNYNDLVKIQPVPSDAFRDSEKLILSVPEKDIVDILTTSSTTSKKPVRYAFDKLTFNRINKANGKLWRLGCDVEIGSLCLMGPRPAESDTGLVRGGYLGWKNAGFRDEDIFFAVRDKKVDSVGIINDLAKAKKPRNLYGPPFIFLAFINYLEEKGETINLDKVSKVVTTGGWKGVSGEVSREELNNKISKYLNIPIENIRDGYGTTDIFTILPECEYHHKHVPPCFNISVRDPQDTSLEVNEGEIGLIVLMSYLIQSYPAFTMPADMGTVIERECECGRNGQIVELKGRAKGSGARGCAIRMEEFMEIITKEKK
jgi:long-chain-fatty-acid---luciferin-component ligase